MSEETEKKKEFLNVEVVHEGKQIVLPKGMSLDEGLKWLRRRRDEAEEVVGIREEVHCYPFEGAYAFYRAMQKRYGWVQATATPSFFGPKPPTMIGVEIGPNETTQVPWGRFSIPNVEGWVSCGIGFAESGFPIFVIYGEVKQKNKQEVAELAADARRIAREESIYKGKAIRVDFPRDDEGDLNITPGDAPKFIDVSQVRESDLIFPQTTQDLIESALFAPIEHTEACRRHQIPLKRGILLEGPYGVGKTLTANVTAKKCVDNGWTFIYLETLSELATALRFARQYSPAVIFAEDLDAFIDGDRDDDTNVILNTLDGVDTKDLEVITVLTSNHVEEICPAMMRPGRLDAVVPVRPPDAAAAERLVRLYARDLLPPNADLSEAGKRLDGQIPAVIREVVERSKLSAIRRGGDQLTLSSEDLVLAAEGMLEHLKLIEVRPVDNRTPVEKAAATVATGMNEAVHRLVQHAAAPKELKNGAAKAALPQHSLT